MLSELDETLRQLLIAEMPIKNNEVDVTFHQPKREWSSRLTRPTINLFLYNLRENAALRQTQWETLPRGDQVAHKKRSPIRVDCYYLITAWASEPEDEHNILTRCMLSLFRFPIIPENRLVDALKKQPYEVMTQLADPDTLTNPSDLWNVLDNELRPGIPYIVTLAFDPWVEVSGPIVRTFTIRPGQARKLPHRTELEVEDKNIDMTFIGGNLWDKDGQALSQVVVGIKDSGISALTNQEGRFVLGALAPGKYTLHVQLPDQKPKEKKIDVPSEDGNYDIHL